MQKIIRQSKRAYPKMVYTFSVNLKNQVYPSEINTTLKFKENNSHQFTSPCNKNLKKKCDVTIK
jgi:hypothetical protein